MLMPLNNVVPLQNSIGSLDYSFTKYIISIIITFHIAKRSLKAQSEIIEIEILNKLMNK